MLKIGRGLLRALSLAVVIWLAVGPVPSLAEAKSRRGKARATSIKKAQKKKTISRSRRSSRRHRGRSRRRARAFVPPTHPGLQNYLSEAWLRNNSTPPPAGTTAAYGNGAPEVAPPKSLNSPTLPLNLLVAAFSMSLAARGYSAENQGLLVEALDGEVLAEHNADKLFNPASVIKIATSLMALSKLGPNYQFHTRIYTDGYLDRSSGRLKGSLYVVGGGDPALFHENAMLIADWLNRIGIYEVEGNLVVQGPFYFSFLASRRIAAREFRKALTPETWNSAARSSYGRFLAMRSAGAGQPDRPPSLKIKGKTLTEGWADTSRLKLLAVHTSLPLLYLLKGLNDFSNNWMATVIGRMMGGPEAVSRFLEEEVGLKAEEARIVTASGLGTNLISPRGTIQILRKLIAYLEKHGLGIEALLPVAGVDAGTLERRFTDYWRGSVVAKTGTLGSQGVSALAGVAYTRNRGPLLFVIFNRGGSVAAFRAVQDETIKKLIAFFGGPAPVTYSPKLGPSVSEKDSPGPR